MLVVPSQNHEPLLNFTSKKKLWLILNLSKDELFLLMCLDILPSPYQELADVQLARLERTDIGRGVDRVRSTEIFQDLLPSL